MKLLYFFMFKLLILIIFFINYCYCQKRACNCKSNSSNNYATKECCKYLNGNFENYGRLGVCHSPTNGQENWKNCCLDSRNVIDIFKWKSWGYNCWDDTNTNY